METQGERKFFVKLWLDDAIQIMAEAKSAAKLLFWYVGRTTVEYGTESGVRCGGVFGSAPVTDFDIARSITGSGAPCTGNQVQKWRHILLGRGYIAYLRTPAGQRTMVIGTDKFPESQIKPLPSWAVEIVNRALILSAERHAKNAERDRIIAGAFRQNGVAFRQNGVPFRQNGGINIRDEVEKK